MASLDVLDYVTRLDDALAQKGVRTTGLRRAGIRDVRRMIDAMAFRFALMDERPLPEDEDYVRALDTLKTPDAVADVLLRSMPIYAKARRRRLTTTYAILGIFLLGVVTLVYYGTSEATVPLAKLSENPGIPIQLSRNVTFNVNENITRIHVDGSIFPARGANGTIEVRLLDPNGDVQMSKSYALRGNNYLRYNINDPQPGRWTLLLDFNDSYGTADITVDGVVPTR